MYIIKKIELDNGMYKSSKIIDHTTKKIATALMLLETNVRNFVKEEFGTKAYEQSKIIDIHQIDQVCEPIVDSMLLYRLSDDPHSIHIYQRRTEVIDQSGWFTTGKVSQTTFKRTHIFELDEYTGLSPDEASSSSTNNYEPHVEMVAIGPNKKIKIPKEMTTIPMFDLIDELKKSDRFRSMLHNNE